MSACVHIHVHTQAHMHVNTHRFLVFGGDMQPQSCPLAEFSGCHVSANNTSRAWVLWKEASPSNVPEKGSLFISQAW